MLQQFLATTKLTVWPLVGLGIFFTTFCLVVVRVLLRRHREEDRRMAHLPLEDVPAAGSKGE